VTFDLLAFLRLAWFMVPRRVTCGALSCRRCRPLGRLTVRPDPPIPVSPATYEAARRLPPLSLM
jgi:hypothetical protein